MPDWPTIPDEPEHWSEYEIRQLIAALRNHGYYNTPTAYSMALILEQLLSENLKLRTQLEIEERRQCKQQLNG